MPEFNGKLHPAKAGQFSYETCKPDQRSGQGFKVESVLEKWQEKDISE